MDKPDISAVFVNLEKPGDGIVITHPSSDQKLLIMVSPNNKLVISGVTGANVNAILGIDVPRIAEGTNIDNQSLIPNEAIWKRLSEDFVEDIYQVAEMTEVDARERYGDQLVDNITKALESLGLSFQLVREPKGKPGQISW